MAVGAARASKRVLLCPLLERIQADWSHWWRCARRTYGLSVCPGADLFRTIPAGLPSGARLLVPSDSLSQATNPLAGFGQEMVGWLLAFSESRGTQGRAGQRLIQAGPQQTDRPSAWTQD